MWVIKRLLTITISSLIISTGIFVIFNFSRMSKWNNYLIDEIFYGLFIGGAQNIYVLLTSLFLNFIKFFQIPFLYIMLILDLIALPLIIIKVWKLIKTKQQSRLETLILLLSLTYWFFISISTYSLFAHPR
jgi:hypothetical protein